MVLSVYSVSSRWYELCLHLGAGSVARTAVNEQLVERHSVVAKSIFAQFVVCALLYNLEFNLPLHVVERVVSDQEQ